MDRNAFYNMIDNIQKFTKEIFSPDGEDEFKIKLIETLNQIMQMDKHLTFTKSSPNVKNMDLPNEIWINIIKYLPSKDVYGSLILVNKRLQSLSLNSGVLRIVKLDSPICKCELDILSSFTSPIKIICGNSLQYQDLERAISAALNLKSLQFFKPKIYKYYFDAEKCHQKIVNYLNQSKTKLEQFDIEDFYYVKPEILIEISKIKTLKSIKITDPTPKILNAFAKSECQLENIEFQDTKPDQALYSISYGKEERKKLSNALNNLLKEKSKTLKKLVSVKCRIFRDSTIPLTNLSLCQNLDEFYGVVQPREYEILAKLPRLENQTKWHTMETGNMYWLIPNNRPISDKKLY